MWQYLKRKWLFLLIVLILLVLNAFAWSFLWEEDVNGPIAVLAEFVFGNVA